LVNRSTEFSGEFRGETVTVLAPALFCSECGYKTVRGDEFEKFQALVADAYRCKKGLLTASEIRARRRALGMSQQEFAAYIKVGIASVKRWELGQVQDRALDELIRIKTDAGHARVIASAVEKHVAEGLKASGRERSDSRRRTPRGKETRRAVRQIRRIG
jgi:putative zinc finger/helix-turn-helix YgiT family protein